jgi:hypothetical protein
MKPSKEDYPLAMMDKKGCGKEAFYLAYRSTKEMSGQMVTSSMVAKLDGSKVDFASNIECFSCGKSMGIDGLLTINVRVR